MVAKNRKGGTHTSLFPYDFVDDNNKSDGMEVAVMKEVAKNCRSMNSSSCLPLMMTF